MDLQTAVTDLISLVNGGQPLEAFDRYFADEGVMLENDKPFGKGKAECRAKQEPILARAGKITNKVTRCSLDVENAICVFRNQTTFVNSMGEKIEIDGVYWQQWSDGKIVEEHYYSGEAMAEKIAEGILDLGTIALEPTLLPPPAQAGAMRTAILAALDALVAAEQIEIAEGAIALVADELIVAGLEAHNPRHALKKLRIALIDSEHVEEVYAADLVLEAAFRRAMGGY